MPDVRARSPRVRRAAAGAAALVAATLACASPAAAARPSTTEYRVTFHAEMSERWEFRELSSRECTVGRCVREEKGAGSARITLDSAGPTPVTVLRTGGNAAPMIHVGTDGLALRGSYRRDGAHTTDYSGEWESANPDEAEATTGCGARSFKTGLGFDWAGRRELRVVTAIDQMRADCPSGPPNFDWDDGAPDLSAVLAAASRSRFGKTRQFTVRGQRKWTGTVPPMNRTDPDDTFQRSGSVEATWQWQATFQRRKR
ncbi:hypothetical protein [Capillimicrobium parvum]|uniref:Lipoprotein n=1 Tax=Capillimicrobium parvum TaxID=2884022 RepID=A0A9E6Y2I5_9ACTN|nr:hypothetical protein [Capillimicrobium parvum]UGS38703.1 hypothetical protein DSM104329_05133 [Capillimicrobium parvum]